VTTPQQPEMRVDSDQAKGIDQGASGGFHASLWSVIGFGSQRVIRLAGNLVLTRLLFPEAFGLMALVQLVQQGLEMLSDLGVVASVVRDEKGDEEEFLQTAWTLQIARGFLLWILSVSLALPVSTFYGQAELKWLIPATSLNLIFIGLSSPALLVMRRHLLVKPVIVIEVAAQLVALAVMIPCAIAWHSVWALVAGSFARVVTLVALSYTLDSPVQPRLRLDAASAQRIIVFGRWILVSTGVAFFSRQGDLAILGKIAEPAMVGCFSVAMMIAGTVFEAVMQLNGRVLFPMLSRTHRATPEQVRAQLGRARTLLLAAFLPLSLVLGVFGEEIIRILYDPRYEPAGWILQIVAFGTSASVISAGSASILLVVGDSFRHMLLQITRAVLLLACTLIGAWLHGVEGLVLGAASSRVLDYPFLVALTRKYGTWMPALDGTAFAMCLLVGLAVHIR